MTISMYQASVEIYVPLLNSLSAVLEKAEKHAEEKGFESAVFMDMRLYPDMFPLARQVRQATFHAVISCAKCAGVEPPAFKDDETSLGELRQRIAKAVEFISSLTPEQINGSEEKEISFSLPSGERKFTGQSLLMCFCMPNFYFHSTTAYDILRHNGVVIGKRDFMGTLGAQRNS